MADALAISAAVVQFLDIAIRLTLQLSSLYKEVRDVPEKLQRLKTDLDQQIAIAKYVESSHASFWNGSAATSAGSVPLDQPLADYIVVMEQLLGTVQMIAKPDAGIVHRSWNALRATQKCKEAITLCDALERKKSNIIMWLSTANMWVPAHSRAAIDGLLTITCQGIIGRHQKTCRRSGNQSRQEFAARTKFGRDILTTRSAAFSDSCTSRAFQ